MTSLSKRRAEHEHRAYVRAYIDKGSKRKLLLAAQRDCKGIAYRNVMQENVIFTRTRNEDYVKMRTYDYGHVKWSFVPGVQ